MDGPIRVLHVDGEGDGGTVAALDRDTDRFDVETVASVEDALDRLDRDAYDCVVSGYELSGMNGVAFLETVREDHPDLPFVLFTGAGSEAVAGDAIAAGVTDYVTREDGTDQRTVLSDRIERAVDQYRVRRQSKVRRDEYQRLFERAPVMYIVTTDRDGEPIIEDCNRLFVDRLGYDREEILGESLTRFYTAESNEALVEGGGFDRALSGELITEEREFRAADGETVETLLRAVPRFDEDGATVGTLALYVDITERKAYERELERKNDRLEELIGVISHDLRNPLEVATGRIELARSEHDSEHLDSAATALERMGTLVDDLLTLAREGKGVRDPGDVDLSGAVKRAWETVATDGATLRTETERTLRADDSRLQRLLANLFRNAVEHGSTGNRTNSDDVTITVGDLDNGFYVADDGPGIPEDERDRVFESGYSSSEDGTGFGLSIVRAIADAHGWDVRVTESEAGGARFEILVD